MSKRQTLPIALALVLVAGVLSGQEPNRNFVEYTKWVSEVIGYGGRVDLEIGRFDSYQDAVDASTAWSQAHPKDLRITREREVKFRQYPTPRSKPQESPSPQPSAGVPGSNSVSTTKPSLGAERDNPDAVTSKTMRMKVGQWDYSVTYNDDGTVTIADTATGRVVGSGTWSQTGKALRIETDNFTYLGLIENGVFSGSRVSKSDRSSEKISMQEATRTPSELSRGTSVVGTWVGTYRSTKGSPFTTTLRFSNDRTVTSTTPSGRTGRGTWSQSGNSVTVTWSNGARIAWNLSGSRLSFSSQESGFSESADLERQ